MTHDLNPFDPKKEPKRHDVAELLLTAQPVTWDMIVDEVGNFSPRSLGAVIRAMEDNKLTLLKVRHVQYGTVYRYDPDAKWEGRYRLSDPNSHDARAERQKKKKSAPSCRVTPMVVVPAADVEAWAEEMVAKQFRQKQRRPAQ